jgi:hypothetical protein
MSKFAWKQAINVPGLKIVSSVLRNPLLAIPHIEINALTELDLSRLQKTGIKFLVFDKDNTLR